MLNNNRIARTLGTAGAALALSLSIPGEAQAATSGSVGCTATGADGYYLYNNYYGPDATINLTMRLTDTASDGNSVRLRMLSKDVNGAVTYWPWRVNSSGYGTTKSWDTTASSSKGLFNIGIQVARINTDGTIRNVCTAWS